MHCGQNLLYVQEDTSGADVGLHNDLDLLVAPWRLIAQRSIEPFDLYGRMRMPVYHLQGATRGLRVEVTLRGVV